MSCEMYRDLCLLKDVETIEEACQWILNNSYLSSLHGNVYRVLMYGKLPSSGIIGFRLENVDTSKQINRSVSAVLKSLGDGIKGYEIYKKALPEYFI